NQSQFDGHNLAYKLFSPYDKDSALSKIIDKSKPGFSNNMASIGSLFLNFGQVFSSFGNILSHKALANPANSYDYGFPEYGFSAAELADPRFENPFDNACHVVGCPNKNIQGFLVDANGNSTSEG